VREYTFDGFGRVRDGTRNGQVGWRGQDLVLDFRDNKLERLRLAGDLLHVDHFDPASTYLTGKPGTVGTGVRLSH
jgi:hypothetical protein